MSYDLAKAQKAGRDPRWTRPCTLMGCLSPRSAHDHHMVHGHLSILACQCSAQDGQPGYFEPEA